MAGPDWKKLRGLARLVHDGVEQGATFVEKHHRHAAAKPFDVLESIEPIALPTKAVRGIHDGVLTAVYGSIRGINGLVGSADGWLVDQLAEASEQAGDGNEDPAAAQEPAAEEQPADTGPEAPRDPT